MKFLRSLLGSRNQRVLRQLTTTVEQINAVENTYQQLTDEQLQAKTPEFRAQLAEGRSLDNLLVDAFATVREASRRVLGLRHFDVQLIGGMVLHQGNIAEMRTGEGKTLSATLPAYLNALSGAGVHIITVNDYLAQRDAEWMKPIYEFLGLTVGVIIADMLPDAKQQAYAADITYGTNNEFGFDYLRDNMALSKEERVQRELNFAIVDEVDSILIDEARTPLIISGAADDSSELYKRINKLIPQLTYSQTGESDFTLDEKTKQAFLTEQGHQRVEQLMQQVGLLKPDDSLYHAVNIGLMHHISAALRAHYLYHRDVDYIVKNDEVIIVDEHTGRSMPGRRWSEGLHQAVEAKEGVAIRQENQTLASITFQNYFRLYDKLAGMTGTADTEAYEFQQIYDLEVVVIPTNKPMLRDDRSDLIYLTIDEKFKAIINDIKDCCARQQPVLVGTASIETSEILSKLLKQEKIKHQVLNAKFHQKEAEIIAQAGYPGSVTIATNMAGRGTDIVLGGNVEAEIAALGDEVTDEQCKSLRAQWQQRHDTVIAAGGLHIIGSERHESRRIDNQLRGRAGRQGDPGSSRFYLSLQDNLMRIFASDRVSALMKRLGMGNGDAIEHPWVTKAIENAQRKVEGYNFDLRKQLLEFDDVANDQRQVVYQQRRQLLEQDEIAHVIAGCFDEVFEALVNQHIPPDTLEEQWDVAGLEQTLVADFALSLPIQHWLNEDKQLNSEGILERVLDAARQLYQQKQAQLGAQVMQQFEKTVMLQSLDHHWREHLASMDHLRQGIHLRGYAQKDPRQEYKREAFQLFGTMLDTLKYSVVSVICIAQIQQPDDVAQLEQQQRHAVTDVHYQHEATPDFAADEGDVLVAAHATTAAATVKYAQPKVGRNEVCPCGSGKKYKHCHGRV
ncbi:MAG: preprotein translocase subunit SecA [Gammaproteobacteria bacterium]